MPLAGNLSVSTELLIPPSNKASFLSVCVCGCEYERRSEGVFKSIQVIMQQMVHKSDRDTRRETGI